MFCIVHFVWLFNNKQSISKCHECSSINHCGNSRYYYRTYCIGKSLYGIIQKRCPMLFGHSVRMDARKILTTVPQSDWQRPEGRPHTSWQAIMKNSLSSHGLCVEDASELALDRPLWRLLAASRTRHLNGASRIMMMTMMMMMYFMGTGYGTTAEIDVVSLYKICTVVTVTMCY